MAVSRTSGATRHLLVSDLPNLLKEGDVLVLNETRVIPARLFGEDEEGRRIEFLLTSCVAEEQASVTWDCLAKPGRRVKLEKVFVFAPGVTGRVLEKPASGLYRIAFEGTQVSDRLLELGTPPLPPYIHRPDGVADERDRSDYQTVFARHPGAIAAPTAGLHLTPELLKTLTSRGVEIARLTLHVGLGTFKPVKVEDTAEHQMDFEEGLISASTAEVLNRALSEKRRVIAVGTTSVRSLESSMRFGNGRFKPGAFKTNLFITPGFEWKAVGALMTNFHLPKSTLLMLVCAFAGRENTLAAYAEAVRMRYRFFSYGDAMWIE